VEPPPTTRRPRLKFSIRDVLLATMLVALFFGWRSSKQQAERRIAGLKRRLAYAESGETWDTRRFQLHQKRTEKPASGLLSRANLEAADLQGGVLVGMNSAFYLTVFNDADLQHASLTGGNAAFQGARFFRTNLTGAKLSGGVSAFQLASFVNADLTGAVLTGGGSSFQGSTFEGSKLVGARLVCSGASFQAVDVTDANFRGADISTLEAESLKSCYFQSPPRYDGKTKFPVGFDPVDEGWKQESN